ncbi:hypothetical protein SAMN04489725_1166 [Alicyclobacillus hesperidum]|uniref:Uncharacterized protein n=1 Tax=Alicyclobacillus hesperidum TaxID=89784 RepID=A0A1H2WN34_9BACL|nr:hypothetical protein SAMN04489725_1166 [Alicyclobacillus hesperidum]
MKVTDLEIGRFGMQYMERYIYTHQPEDIPPASVLLGVLVFIVSGFILCKIIDWVIFIKYPKIKKTNDLVTPLKGEY